MARGDVVLFEEFVREEGEGVHNFSTDTLKLGIIDNTVTPTAADATPRWSDYSANEVATAGGYTANGETLANVTWTEVGGTATLDADNVSLAQNASGFTDGYWGILYNDSATNDEAIAFIDLGGPISEQNGPVSINFNAAGIFTKAV